MPVVRDLDLTGDALVTVQRQHKSGQLFAQPQQGRQQMHRCTVLGTAGYISNPALQIAEIRLCCSQNDAAPLDNAQGWTAASAGPIPPFGS